MPPKHTQTIKRGEPLVIRVGQQNVLVWAKDFGIESVVYEFQLRKRVAPKQHKQNGFDVKPAEGIQ